MRHWNINIEVAGGEADPTRLAVGDDVDRVKTVAAVERGGDLLRHRAGGVEEDRLDLGAQVVENRASSDGSAPQPELLPSRSEMVRRGT